MNRVKINYGLASLALVASLFGGWEAMLIVCILLLLFCEIDEKTKSVMTRVITFAIALSLVSLGWSIIYKGIDVVKDGISAIVDIKNTYAEPLDYISASKFTTPLREILSVADSIVSLLIILAKFFFVISLLTNREEKKSPLSKHIGKFVSQAINFVNNINVSYQQPMQTMQQPVQPMQNMQQPVQPMQNMQQPVQPQQSMQNMQ